MGLREVLQDKRDKEKPLPFGPRKGRPWGRRQRRKFREDNDLYSPGEFLGFQLHPKNAACRRKYIEGKARLTEMGLTPDAYEVALEELQGHYTVRVPIFQGLNNRVRKQMRSEYLRQERKEQENAVESGSGDPESSPPNGSQGANP